ncbi:DUF5959 family protein [Kitasatospora sp. NPDC089797]|uniref:DUF5959 family protein n=1 Tax=Kitasatospora sp. NPDC089797 TaxID=3155298 RepID=UPI003447445B
MNGEDLSGDDVLLHLADRENSVVIRVLGRGGTEEREQPDAQDDHEGGTAGYLEAEVVVASTFCNGRLPLRLSQEDLEDWAEALDELADGHSVCWMTDLRNPEIAVEFDSQFSVPLVTVEDVQGSGSAMAVPVDLADGWIDEQRERLARVLRS